MLRWPFLLFDDEPRLEAPDGVSVDETAAGGTLLGGSGSDSSSYSEVAAGGVLLNGTSDVSGEVYNDTALGGVAAGGSAAAAEVMADTLSAVKRKIVPLPARLDLYSRNRLRRFTGETTSRPSLYTERT